MRWYAFLVVGFLLVTGCNDLSHTNPYDPDSPLGKQARASLRGSVVLEGDYDPRSATVVVQYAGGQQSISPGETGEFVLNGIPPGLQVVKIDAPFFSTYSERLVFSLGETLVLAEPIALSRKRSPVVGSVVVEEIDDAPLPSVSGSVVTLRESKKISKGARFAAAALTPTPTFTATVSSTGTYSFSAVPAGVYAVSAESTIGTTPQEVEVRVEGEGEVEIEPLVIKPLTGNFSILQGLYTQTAGVDLELSGFNASEMRIGQQVNGLCSYTGAFVTYDYNAKYTLVGGEGRHTVCVRYRDESGNETADYVRSIVYDATPPSFNSIQVDGGAAYTRLDGVHLALKSFDSNSGLATMRIGGQSDLSGEPVLPFAPERTNFALPLTTDGMNYLWVAFGDAAGNYSAPVSAGIIKDTVAPSGSIAINQYGATVTSVPFVTLLLNTDDAVSMQVSEDATFSDTDWVPFSSRRSFLLGVDDGPKMVNARFRDAAGNISPSASAGIWLDSTPPSAPYVIIAVDVTSSTTVQVSLGSSEAAEMLISEGSDFVGASWQQYVPVTDVTVGGADGAKNIFAKFRNAALSETSVASDSFVLDRDGPSHSGLTINHGAAYVTSNLVSLQLTAYDAVSAVQYMQVSESPTFNGAVVQPYVVTLVHSLSAGEGAKTVYARYADRAHNYSAAVSATVGVDTQRPSIGSFEIRDLGGNPVTASNSARVTVAMDAADASPLQMMLSNRPDFWGGVWQPYEPAVQWDLPLPTNPLGESRTVYGKVRDLAGNVTSSATPAITLDTIGPTGVSIDIVGSSTTSPTVTVTLGFVNADRIHLSQDISFGTKLEFAAQGSTTYTLAGGDGTKFLYARFLDFSGNQSATVADQVEFDRTPPQLADFTIVQGAYTNQQSINLELTALEAAEMQIQESVTCGGAWVPFATTYAYSLPTTYQGVHPVSVRFRDAAQNATACLTKQIELDTVPPAFTAGNVVTINGGAVYTSDRAVSVAFAVTGAAEMQLSENSAFVGAVWGAFLPGVSISLGAGDGAKTIYARFRDLAGNATTVQSGSITLDTVGPTFNAVTSPLFVSGTTVPLTLTASGATEMRISQNADFAGANWVAFAAVTDYTVTSGEGLKSLYVELRDQAGNQSLVRSVNVTLDQTAPSTPNVSVLGGAYVNQPSATLQIVVSEASDVLMSQYAPMTDATWQPYSLLKVFTVAGAEGAKTVYVKVRDAAGNVSPIGSTTVYLDQSSPTVTQFRAEDFFGNAISSTSSLRYNLRLAVTDASPVTVQFSSSTVFAGTAVETLQPLRSWEVQGSSNPLGEDRTAYARLVDAAGNERIVGPVTVLVDTIGPTSPAASFSASLVSTTTGSTLNLVAFNADWVELSNDISFLNPDRMTMRSSTPVTLGTGDGVKTTYVRFADLHGNYSAVVAASITLDQTPPQLPDVIIDEGATAKSSPIHLTLNAVDAAEMQVRENDCAGPWLAYTRNYVYNLTDTTQGPKTIAVRYRDKALNGTQCIRRNFLLDGTAPYITAAKGVVINGDATSTTERTVTLAMNVTDATEMKISEFPSFQGANWVPFAPTYTWPLSTGDGEKTVFALFRDLAGNETAVQQDSIFLTQSKPNVTILDGQYTRYTTVRLQILANSASEVLISQSSSMTDATFQPYNAVMNFTLTGADGPKTVYVRVKDTSGNLSAQSSASVTLDRTAPGISLFRAEDVNGDPITYSTSTRYYLRLDATDLSPMTVQYSPYPSFIGVFPEEYQLVRPWDVQPNSDPAGEMRTTYARVVDGAGNASIVGPVEVLVDAVDDPQAESTVRVSPAYVSTSTVTVLISSQTAAGVEIDESPFFNNPLRFSLVPSTTYTFLSPQQGWNTLYARFYDIADNYGTPLTAGVFIDTVPPGSVGFSILEAPATARATVTLASTTTGATEMQVSEGTCGGAWVPFEQQYAYTFSSAVNGYKTVAVRYRDAADLRSSCVTQPILLDTALANITGVSPSSGSAGSTVWLFGTNIGVVDNVEFDGVPASILSSNSSSILVVVPDGLEAGLKNIVVTSDGRTSSGFPFTVVPGISSLTPVQGYVGALVQLTGTDLGTQADGWLLAGGIEPTIASWTPTAIGFYIPVGIGGRSQSVELRVNGVSAPSRTIVVLPRINSLTPLFGPLNAVVTLIGTNFGFVQGSSQLVAGGVFPNVLSWSDTEISFEIPNGAPPGNLPIYVSVSGYSTNTVYFEFQKPWIDARSPRLAAEGETMWLIGQYFGPTSGTVYLGGSAATVQSWATDAVQVVVPAGLASGDQPVWMVTAQGSGSNVLSYFHRGNDQWIPGENPTQRTGHVAVWSGKEMIIWGGSDVNLPLLPGAKYNPATDSWVPVSPLGAPLGREGVTAVWSGTEMMVYGDDTIGGRYDPALDEWLALPTAGAPEPRVDHTAVWTGSEMIVWGGMHTDSTIAGTGGRFSPALGMWMPSGISLTQAPSPRYYHTAVWTGSSMIVWGGHDGMFHAGTGARYNPGSDTWIALTNSGAPTGRVDHTAVWTGAQMVVFGGRNGGGRLSNGARYDAVSDAWSGVAPLAAGLDQHTAVWAGTRMLVWGGFSNGIGYVNAGWSYDPATDNWVALSDPGAPAPRGSHSAVWTGTEMLVWGGIDGGSSALDTGGRYILSADAWAPTGQQSHPSARAHSASVWTGAEMLIWGGIQSGRIWATGSRYSPILDSWMYMSTVSAPVERAWHSAVWTGTDMLVWGGRNSVVLNSGALYSPPTDSWRPITDGSAPSMLFDDFEGPLNWVVTGTWATTSTQAYSGSYSLTESPSGDYANSMNIYAEFAYPVTIPANTVAKWMYKYDSESNYDYLYFDINCTGSWIRLHTTHGTSMGMWQQATVSLAFGWGKTCRLRFWFRSDGSVTRDGFYIDDFQIGFSGITARQNHTAIWTGDEMVVWGGQSAVNEGYLNSGNAYNPTTEAWRALPASALVPRTQHSAVWTGDRMLVWGGYSGGGRYADGEVYWPAGNTWTTLAGFGAPTGRSHHTAVWTGNEMIIWGGISSVPEASGGLYYPDLGTGGTWASMATAPTARLDHMAVWADDRMLLWGGRDLSGPYNSGYAYHTTNDSWTPLSTLGQPSPRYAAEVVWTGQEMIIWGGTTGPHDLSDGARYFK